jgi:hypothetical protein
VALAQTLLLAHSMPTLLILAVILLFGWGAGFFLLALGPIVHLVLVIAVALAIIHFVMSARTTGART